MQFFKSLFCNSKEFTLCSVIFLGVIIFLSGLGLSEMLSAYSPSAGWESIISLFKPEEMFFKQLCFFVIGFALCVFISNMRLREMKKLSGFEILALGLGVLFLQLLTIAGPAINGSHRWLPLISLQPSEVIPIYGILALAWGKYLKSGKWQWIICIFLFALCFTVFKPQDNLSTAAVYLFGFFLIFIDLYCKKYFKLIVCAAAIGIVLVLSVSMFFGSKYRAESSYPCSSFRCKRLVNWAMYDLSCKLPVEKDWNPAEDGLKYKYQDKFQKYVGADGSQPVYAKTAIIESRLIGDVLINMNEVNNRNRIAISYADYIFAVLAAEHGFILSFGTLIIIAFLMLWLWSHIINNASNIYNGDPFLLNLSKGVIIMLSLQCLVHIWVNLSLMPVTGIPLPLFSHGGSSLLSTFAMLGILLNMTKIPVK